MKKKAAREKERRSAEIYALKAHNEVLIAEIKFLKSQVVILSEKGSPDKELIKNFMKQQENL